MTTFVELLDVRADERPDAAALTCEAVTLTRADVRDLSRSRAADLAAQGVVAGDFVSIALPNSPDFLVWAIAAWRLGAVPQPLSHRMAPPELQAIADLVRPRGIVGTRIPGHAELVPGAGDGPLPDDAPVSPYWKAPTSGGSTGRPKVIVANAPALAEQVLPFGDLLLMPADDVALVPGPLHHNAPFMFATLALLRGNHVVLQPRFDAETCLIDVARHRARWMYAVPTMMQRIWRLDPEVRERHDLSSLEHVVHMAAPCPPWLKRAWIEWLGPRAVIEVYAATEAQAATRIDGVEWLARPGSAGRVILGEMQVLDDDLRPVAPGTVGRIWMRRGPDAEPPYFYVGAAAKAADGGWECLGDIGVIDADGYVFLTDRDSDMILVGGSNVYPAEVEAAIDEHPSVLSCCVIGLPEPDLGAVPHAIVHASRPVSDEELVAFVRERLSPYKLPRSFEYVDESVRDDAGKVRRSALRAARLEKV
ncbi:MAG: AMP-binding protein [Actinobacteria bacterium]|uniref:Unannotated protein n=1 Tax=freshwater metagenome TaxID=449393 RepID=A0A6J6NTG2_9ZZZZ|nr:AMP-binding protein [Actinomycetota bacterium]